LADQTPEALINLISICGDLSGTTLFSTVLGLAVANTTEPRPNEAVMEARGPACRTRKNLTPATLAFPVLDHSTVAAVEGHASRQKWSKFAKITETTTASRYRHQGHLHTLALTGARVRPDLQRCRRNNQDNQTTPSETTS